jgi:hypothetical protein
VKLAWPIATTGVVQLTSPSLLGVLRMGLYWAGLPVANSKQKAANALDAPNFPSDSPKITKSARYRETLESACYNDKRLLLSFVDGPPT